MTRYLLDTNAVSEIIRNGQDSVVRKRMAEIGEARVCTSIVVAAEIRYGITRRASPRLTEAAERVLDLLPIIPFERPADEIYGRIRADLAREGRLIGPNDFLIAAHSLALDATLVTDNLCEFRRVAQLTVETWLGGDVERSEP